MEGQEHVHDVLSLTSEDDSVWVGEVLHGGALGQELWVAHHHELLAV